MTVAETDQMYGKGVFETQKEKWLLSRQQTNKQSGPTRGRGHQTCSAIHPISTPDMNPEHTVWLQAKIK